MALAPAPHEIPHERFFAGEKFVKGKSKEEGASRIDPRDVSPLREPTRSPFETLGKMEANAKKRRRLARVELPGLRDEVCSCLRRAGRAPPLQRRRKSQQTKSGGSEGDGGAGAAGGAVDGFDQGDGFAAFGAVADGLGVCANRVQKVFEDLLVAADVGDRGGRGA